MMTCMPSIMVEKLKDHTRNENKILGGRLNEFFLASHFLRPKIYFWKLGFWYILINIYILHQIDETRLFDNSFWEIMLHVFPENGFFKKGPFQATPQY